MLDEANHKLIIRVKFSNWNFSLANLLLLLTVSSLLMDPMVVKLGWEALRPQKLDNGDWCSWWTICGRCWRNEKNILSLFHRFMIILLKILSPRVTRRGDLVPFGRFLESLGHFFHLIYLLLDEFWAKFLISGSDFYNGLLSVGLIFTLIHWSLRHWSGSDLVTSTDRDGVKVVGRRSDSRHRPREGLGPQDGGLVVVFAVRKMRGFVTRQILETSAEDDQQLTKPYSLLQQPKPT